MSWRDLRVAPDSTHHVIGDEPAYALRFDAVGKFHDPGLAPVRLGEQAWHIDATGEPAYAARFRRTFGFYDERAAVDDGAAWFYIDPRGHASPGRYAWCGNFQFGRAPVRDFDGAYFHVDRAGHRGYTGNWRYAGDYRDGIAVVQAADGLHTHIDLAGHLLHDRWFIDLDVFHKGYARARDERGWTHVDAKGIPSYARRFAAVEPFYNGQARVECFDGSLEVVDESGRTLVGLRGGAQASALDDDAFSALSSDLVGYWRTAAIAGAVELGVFEHLPAESADLARACGMPEARAVRLLRALAELALVRRVGSTWVADPRGELLREDHPKSLAAAAREYVDPLARPWQELSAALVDPAWQPPRVFEQIATEPQRLAQTHAMLRSYARHDYTELPRQLALRGHERIIDAAGGTGALAELLLSRHPGLDLVLLERSEVLALRDPGLRVTPLAKDIFDSWEVEADLVILARILHDWDDEAALRILARARAALRPHARLAIVDMILAEDAPGGGLCDLHLLVVNGGGERTLAQWRALLERAELVLERVVPLSGIPQLLLARAERR